MGTKEWNMHTRIIKANEMFSRMSKRINDIVVGEEFSKTIDIILSCKGKIITSGVGKAAIAMKKFSSLLCSFGFPSAFLNPLDAQHGDLGILSENDVLFLSSNSGKTREVLELIDLSRAINIKTIIGLSSHLDSPLKSKVDVCIDMGKIEEEGHLKMAPTTSILVMLAITDALALIAAEEINLSLESYSKLHHSGYLGTLARERQNKEKK